MARFEGRIAVITGGAKGIGESIVRKFYAEGAKIAIIDVNRAEVKAAFEEITGKFVVLLYIRPMRSLLARKIIYKIN